MVSAPCHRGGGNEQQVVEEPQERDPNLDDFEAREIKRWKSIKL
jgi:hypothetical protein